MLLVCATLATGCAVHRPASLADRFITEGEPSIDLGGTIQQPLAGPDVAQLRKLAATAKPHAKDSTAEVAEGRDPRLRDRLALLKKAPSAEHHRDVAIEYRRLGIADAAFDHLSSAIRLDPKDAASFDLRARLWRSWRLPEFGVPDARKAVALAPQSATAWNTLGLLLEDSRKVPDGITAYLKAVELDDQAAYAWSNLCRVLTARTDTAAAIKACRRAIGLDPASEASQRHLAEAERSRLFIPVADEHNATLETIGDSSLDQQQSRTP
jgi:tetratricopeptide (TPR) repeat protein